MSKAAGAVRPWRPSQEELDRIMAEMGPIIRAFVERARQVAERR
jgi:hypothetical protein